MLQQRRIAAKRPAFNYVVLHDDGPAILGVIEQALIIRTKVRAGVEGADSGDDCIVAGEVRAHQIVRGEHGHYAINLTKGSRNFIACADDVSDIFRQRANLRAHEFRIGGGEQRLHGDVWILNHFRAGGNLAVSNGCDGSHAASCIGIRRSNCEACGGLLIHRGQIEMPCCGLNAPTGRYVELHIAGSLRHICFDEDVHLTRSAVSKDQRLLRQLNPYRRHHGKRTKLFAIDAIDVAMLNRTVYINFSAGDLHAEMSFKHGEDFRGMPIIIGSRTVYIALCFGSTSQ